MIPSGQNNFNPQVSVIIPTFNRGWIIQEALESVLSQEYSDFELIIVDDGSTDDTASVLDQFQPDIRLVRQPNRGVSAARNRGMSVSRGNYIAFLDSDDLWLPSKLQRQVDFFDSHPEALICQTEEIWIKNGKRLIPGEKHRKASGYIFDRSLQLCLVSPSAVMMRRRLFDDCGNFDEDLPACEDYDLWLRISSRIPIHLIDEPLVIKRGGHPDQLSRAPGLDRFRVQALLKILERGKLSLDQREKAVRVLREKCGIYANGCLKRDRRDEADRYFRIARRYA